MSQRILIVEDNPIEPHEVSYFIREAGFEVDVATDTEGGVERLKTETFDLLLCDLHLPGDNGFELCRRVKHRGELPNVPVILLTRYSDPLNFLRGLEAGADGFISKGQSPTNIIARLKRVLSRRQSSGPEQPYRPDRVVFLETEFEVNAERSQLLEVLLSGFEDVVHLNDKYEEEVQARVRAQQSQRNANAQLQSLNETLEQRVAQRTKELQEYAHKLEKENAELDQFVYMASHDLQEPVRKLISCGELLKKDIDDNLNERSTGDLYYIADAACRMQTLVQDLLALSRAGRSAIRREFVSLDECADRALEALSLRVDETGAEIVRDPLPDVIGDTTTLTQLYQNLIGNALKFVNNDKPVVLLTAEETEHGWTLGVRDNGIGIAQEHAEQIFAPFQRLCGRNEYTGTGIGLAICRTTVERHGGHIWVESNLGEGSHFRFTLAHRAADDSGRPECDRAESVYR